MKFYCFSIVVWCLGGCVTVPRADYTDDNIFHKNVSEGLNRSSNLLLFNGKIHFLSPISFWRYLQKIQHQCQWQICWLGPTLNYLIEKRIWQINIFKAVSSFWKNLVSMVTYEHSNRTVVQIQAEPANRREWNPAKVLGYIYKNTRIHLLKY